MSFRFIPRAKESWDALHARFRDYTCKLFEKHGITNVGYWVPLENTEHKLYYIISFPAARAQKTSWAAFMADPDWKSALAASEKDGKLVTHVDSTFMHATDFSPEIKSAIEKEPRVRLRTYTCTPGNLGRLHARFRDHTMALFSKQGMTNFAYFQLDPDQKGANDTLVYMLRTSQKRQSPQALTPSARDPDWIAAKEASEKAAGGSLTVKDGVKSVLLTPTDYSPTK